MNKITNDGEAESLIEELYETNKFGKKYVRYDKKPKKELIEYYKEKYNINTNCHGICQTCQITHIQKHKKSLELENSKSMAEENRPLSKWFTPQCSFIP